MKRIRVLKTVVGSWYNPEVYSVGASAGFGWGVLYFLFLVLLVASCYAVGIGVVFLNDIAPIEGSLAKVEWPPVKIQNGEAVSEQLQPWTHIDADMGFLIDSKDQLPVFPADWRNGVRLGHTSLQLLRTRGVMREVRSIELRHCPDMDLDHEAVGMICWGMALLCMALTFAFGLVIAFFVLLMIATALAVALKLFMRGSGVPMVFAETLQVGFILMTPALLIKAVGAATGVQLLQSWLLFVVLLLVYLVLCLKWLRVPRPARAVEPNPTSGNVGGSGDPSEVADNVSTRE